MNIKQITILTSCGVFLFALIGCKTLQETAESKEVTQPEAVTLMIETELRKT